MPETKEVKQSWASTPHKREKWVLNEHGPTVKHPNAQSSNNGFPDNLIFSPRNEPIGQNSNAFPLKSVDPYPGEFSVNKKLQNS